MRKQIMVISCSECGARFCSDGEKHVCEPCDEKLNRFLEEEKVRLGLNTVCSLRTKS